MNGLELSRGYFEEFGRQMLENEFAGIIDKIAVGCVGSGSDRYGFDDEVSRDHDYEPGFCIFLPNEDIIDSKEEFRLERAYAKLPKEYMGFKRQTISPVGGNRNGVLRLEEFYLDNVGTKNGKMSSEQWLRLPDYALAQATNGEVFFDGLGEFTAVRERLMNMPEDVKLKRIAGNLLLAAQSGQYNYTRCIRHGEEEASQLAATEFTQAIMKTFFLLNGKYMPYYKWSFRALRNIPGGKELGDKLSFLLFGDKKGEVFDKKYDMIEEISSDIISILIDRNITKAVCGDLEKHAYSVNDFIKDGNLRNLHILAGV